MLNAPVRVSNHYYWGFYVHLFVPCLFLVFSLTGLRPVDFWGNCYMSNTTDVELAMIDPHKVGSVSNLSIFLFKG